MYRINLYQFVFLIFANVLLTVAEDCDYYDGNGICVESCPDGMNRHIYECEEETMSQRTCRQPVPRSMGILCDQTRCDCPESKVLDEAASKCVNIEDCSDQSKIDDDNVKELKSLHD